MPSSVMSSAPSATVGTNSMRSTAGMELRLDQQFVEQWPADRNR
jgi:hypothetical protein